MAEQEVLAPEDPGGKDLVPLTGGLMDGLTRAELDVQITTALRHRRVITMVKRQIETLATLDDAAAASCFYSLPRRRKNKDTGKWETFNLEGPTIRFAEMVLISYGNSRIMVRRTDITEDDVEATAIFHDLENNVSQAASVRRPIRNSEGQRYALDMINMTTNAAASIARRNIILAAVPRGIWGSGYNSALKAAKGEASTLPTRITNLIKVAGEIGVSEGDLLAMLEAKSRADITIDSLYTAAGFVSAIREGEETVDSILNARRPPMDERGLDEAFGGRGRQSAAAPSGTNGNKPATATKSEKPADPSTGPQPARTAAPPKDTPASATPASSASQGEFSGPPPSSPRQGDGATVETNRGAEAYGRGSVDSRNGMEEDFPGDRKPPQETPVVVQDGLSDPDGTTTPQTGNGHPETSSGPEEEVDTESFNGWAEAVRKTDDVGRLMFIASEFRASEAYLGAGRDMQRRAMELAWIRLIEQQPDANLEEPGIFRLWISAVADRVAIMPTFRKLTRTLGYQNLTPEQKDAIAKEVQAAAKAE